MGKIYEYQTAFGAFRIESRSHGWIPTFRERPLDGYFATPEAALRDLAEGISDATEFGTAAELGVPRELSRWTQLQIGLSTKAP